MDRSIGENIRHYMNYRGLTQKELAKKAGITEAAICRYLKGDRAPRAITVANIARALDVSPAELIGSGKGEMNELDNAVRLVARNARSMSAEQREEIIRALSER